MAGHVWELECCDGNERVMVHTSGVWLDCRHPLTPVMDIINEHFADMWNHRREGIAIKFSIGAAINDSSPPFCEHPTQGFIDNPQGHFHNLETDLLCEVLRPSQVVYPSFQRHRLQIEVEVVTPDGDLRGWKPRCILNEWGVMQDGCIVNGISTPIRPVRHDENYYYTNAPESWVCPQDQLHVLQGHEITWEVIEALTQAGRELSWFCRDEHEAQRPAREAERAARERAATKKRERERAR